jgi:quercetin dioxygenase-like cupin family protein
MGKGRLVEQLDDAVDAILADQATPGQTMDKRIEPLLRLAQDLAHLPKPAFKLRLRAALFGAARRSRARSAIEAGDPGRPILRDEDIDARLSELASAPALLSYDVNSALDDLPDGAMRFLTAMGPWTVGVTSCSNQRPTWERHPAADEVLYVLDGGLDVTTMTPAGPIHSSVDAGAVFVCPKGLWHWPRPRDFVSMIFMTPGEGTEHSAERYPVRSTRKRPSVASRSSGRRSNSRGKLPVHDVRATLDRASELNISTDTTAQEADAAFPSIAKFERYTLGGGRFSGLTPWERHPDGDELLYALEGSVDVTVLTEHGAVRRTIPEGSIFICPRGLWHRQLSRDVATMIYATPTETSEHSFADDPRVPV